MAFIESNTTTLAQEFEGVRRDTLNLVSTLEVEDFVPQAAEFTSPPRWHLAHTTWLFEMLMKQYTSGYQPFREEYFYQFNSYYNRFGERIPRPERGHRSRPTVRDILIYRSEVEKRVLDFLRNENPSNVSSAFKMGIEHEKQHQELLVWDIKFHLNDAFKIPFLNKSSPIETPSKNSEIYLDEGVVEVGYDGDGFSWDNERPRHKQYVHRYCIDRYPVTNGEFQEFIQADGYRRPEFWLSDGWKFVQTACIEAPQYWENVDNRWYVRDLRGLRRIDHCAHEPVSHVSYYEADAYARWKKKRLASEAEWEQACQKVCRTHRTSDFKSTVNQNFGQFIDEGEWRPCLQNKMGDTPFFFGAWEWTSSDYSPFPGFVSDFVEYNDKWFINQKVLRGGSYATRRDHYRLTYRNFFYPHDRWIGTGFRCARTIL